jgi:UDP-3-O-[3-hydroxymyristoyl] glucosamine N-acyltransferase
MPVEPKTVAELAAVLSGQAVGDAQISIQGVSSIEDALPGDIVFAENARYLGLAQRSKASAVIAPVGSEASDKPLIVVDNPRASFSAVLALFAPQNVPVPGIHPSAVVGEGVVLEEGVSIGPLCSIGAGTTVGPRTTIEAGTVVGDHSRLGADVILHGNVTLADGTEVGNRAIIHSGAVIGADGFGYVLIGSTRHKVPQIGIVQIGEDVEIGANTTIDRAKTGATVIGARTKIDNLVHIAHNCKIGEDCVIVAQVGIAGSVTLGNGVIVAGQAGINPGVKVGDRAMVLGQSGCWSDVEAGAVVSGDPAKPHKQRLRQVAAIGDLPEALSRLKKLEKQYQELLAKLNDTSLESNAEGES